LIVLLDPRALVCSLNQFFELAPGIGRSASGQIDDLIPRVTYNKCESVVAFILIVPLEFAKIVARHVDGFLAWGGAKAAPLCETSVKDIPRSVIVGVGLEERWGFGNRAG
jgi:undecaprenyl pyrophosphate phosphatase UppP